MSKAIVVFSLRYVTKVLFYLFGSQKEQSIFLIFIYNSKYWGPVNKSNVKTTGSWKEIKFVCR